MRADIEEFCDSLDSAVFTGGGFVNDKVARQEFRDYMARWERGLKEHEASEENNEST